MSTLPSLKIIDVHQLLLDVENPRLPAHAPDQPSTIQAMAGTQGKNLVGMAEHILEHGPSPADLPIVMPAANGSYIVLDGNRRLTALKALESPSLIDGAVPSAVLKQIKELSKQYHKNPVDSLRCFVAADRVEADPWIQNRHRGLRGGSGLDEWDGYVAARYDALTGDKSIALQVIDFVTGQSKLSEKSLTRIRSGKFPVTTLERILKTPYVRSKLGFDIKKGDVTTQLPTSEVVKGLARIVEDVGSGDVTVTDVKKVDQRIKYVDSFVKEDLPDLTKSSGKPRPVDEEPPIAKKKRKRPQPKPRTRTTLIPPGLSTGISQHRIQAIAEELQSLNADKHPNAAAVMMRVLIELSLDHFLEQTAGWSEQKVDGSHLAQKLTAAANHLKQSGAMSDQQLAPVKKAAAGQTLLAASIRTMHGYVHNRYFSAVASELKTAWDDLQMFMTKIWS
ncbi:hypothetical protein [Rubrivirga sp. SAORIC476]|uniref:hypothetical protein n=1 Tax=Rubrivirga sp. SAORIC476 TaxID=1961794 RepID=UPI00117A52F5|nr:hypothetical protein [Rubrivirga sp. SAORIC476]